MTNLLKYCSIFQMINHRTTHLEVRVQITRSYYSPELSSNKLYKIYLLSMQISFNSRNRQWKVVVIASFKAPLMRTTCALRMISMGLKKDWTLIDFHLFKIFLEIPLKHNCRQECSLMQFNLLSNRITCFKTKILCYLSITTSQ